jgi:hypothetical protein
MVVRSLRSICAAWGRIDRRSMGGDFLGRYSDLVTEEGRQRVVRHGHLPEREIMTGIGPVPVRAPRVRDRAGQDEPRIRFSSTILPPYARRTRSLEVLIPVLYLKGVSTGNFEEALSALLGKDAVGLSDSTIARLKDSRADEHVRWSKHDLSAKRYVYFWADGYMSKPGSKIMPSASWSLLARRPKAKRNSSASRMGCARVRNPGGSCCSIHPASATIARGRSPGAMRCCPHSRSVRRNQSHWLPER